jgi:hemoglobin
MAGTFRKNVPLLANDSARGTHLLRSPFPPHKQLPLPKNILTAGWKFSLRQQTSYLLEPLRKKLNYAKNMAEMFNYKINYFRNAGQNGDLLNLK